jgi:flagellar basal-body rod protein FlgG
MSDGLYTAAAGLAAQQAWLDSLSNDIANVNTPGYRPGRVAFRDLLYQQEAGTDVGSGVALGQVGRSAQAGALSPSDNPLAVAIDGPGYLQVGRADGSVALTRAGDLRVDRDGLLVTADGNPLEPRVRLPKGTDPAKVEIGSDGTVMVGGAKLGKIAVVDVPAPNGLSPVGAGLLVATPESGATVPATAWQLKQRFVEASGVDVATAMIDLVSAQRGFALQSRVIKMQDQLMEIANGIRR